MKHLIRSFQRHLGERGTHFYDDESCHFLTWQEVIQFINSLPNKEEDVFTEKLAESLSNYDPDSEFLAVQQNGTQISVELYSAATDHAKYR